MKLSPLQRSLLLGLGQLALLGSLGAKLGWDRQTLPRVWTKTVSVDPSLPIRGRYVELHLQARVRENGTEGPVVLRVEGQELVAAVDPLAGRAPGASQVYAWGLSGQAATLSPSVAFFIPEQAPDPTRRRPGDELWAEVTVPPRGLPRPIRLGIKRGDGPIQPL